MGLSENTKIIEGDICRCLNANGFKVELDDVYINGGNNTLVVKAFSDDKNGKRNFSFELDDEFIYCDEDETLKIQIADFKTNSLEVKNISINDAIQSRKESLDYYLETGSISETEYNELCLEAEAWK